MQQHVLAVVSETCIQNAKISKGQTTDLGSVKQSLQSRQKNTVQNQASPQHEKGY